MSHDHPHPSTADKTEKPLSTREKLARMIHHWIHHTEDHVQSYRQWAQRAQEEGLPSVARALERVADGSLELNRILEEAQKELDEMGNA
ncbi:hypothetical protein SAMN02746041_00299 [Desulfacinum hydrothermale DSM 13146]|uniref:DUF8180 domain-containing protein n=1 Tax=Desulfacinum hydrothermale DSM 13146 TaxID=1121390 RepID=A0A1W1X059_9BACT|nr:hypothetical protein [Desulfacinum hydrothermale]SMC17362.1 hypothetical protein SAMN02746041_00299 [Desulfacinum hydrothermale DSM 13146]